jgi:hypothetical protein
MLIIDLRPFLLARSPGLAPSMVTKAESQAVALSRGELPFFSHPLFSYYRSPLVPDRSAYNVHIPLLARVFPALARHILLWLPIHELSRLFTTHSRLMTIMTGLS